MRTPLVPRARALFERGLPGLVLRERDLADAPFLDAAHHLREFLARPPKGPDAQRWIAHAQSALEDAQRDLDGSRG